MVTMSLSEKLSEVTSVLTPLTVPDACLLGVGNSSPLTFKESAMLPVSCWLRCELNS